MLTSQKLNTPGGFPVLTVVIIPVLELPIAFEVFRHQVLPFTVKIGARLVLQCPALIASIPPQSELPVEESSSPEVCALGRERYLMLLGWLFRGRRKPSCVCAFGEDYCLPHEAVLSSGGSKFCIFSISLFVVSFEESSSCKKPVLEELGGCLWKDSNSFSSWRKLQNCYIPAFSLVQNNSSWAIAVETCCADWCGCLNAHTGTRNMQLWEIRICKY